MKQPCGYCKYHHKKLSVKELKRKGCLCKENIGNTCRHLVKYEGHGWWINRKIKNDNKKKKEV